MFNVLTKLSVLQLVLALSVAGVVKSSASGSSSPPSFSRNQVFRQSILLEKQEYVDSFKTHDIRLLLTILENLPVPQH